MSEKVAWVTGASRGIGREIALKLASMDCFTVGTATSLEGAWQITKSLSGVGAGGVGVLLDLSESDNIKHFLKEVIAEYGAPLMLVNNAGITRDNLILRMKPEEWDQVLTTNLSAVYRLTQGVIRGMMKARWGRILNISSAVARMGNAGQVNYVAAKAGLEGFTRALALELASRNITVNSIAPGFIDTDMTAALTDTQRETLLGLVPLGRSGRPQEVAAVAGFLCSDMAGYITGETIHVNGGLRMD